MTDCPVCLELRREYNTAAEQEAKATIEHRSECFHLPGPVDRRRHNELILKIQDSRRRQAKLAEVLDRHLTEHSAA